MRIIAGTAKGTRLTAPTGREVRPTLDRVREALFSILMSRIEGVRFLDLFAGTGANGVEALSRGAASATFVDNDPRSLELVRRNLEAARLAEHGQVRRLELPKGLATLAREGTTYGIVFADPPYGFAKENPQAYGNLIEAASDARIAADGALFVIEHDSRVILPDSAGFFARVRTAKYGETALSIFS